MNRFIGALAAAAVVGMASVSGVNASKATDDLGTLVHANLAEAATLQAQLPSLSGHRSAIRVWKHMIMDHKNGAMMLAGIDKKMGGSPDTSMPSADAPTGSYRQIVATTLQAHRDTLKKVQGMVPHSTRAERKVLYKVEGVVSGHIRMIRTLSRRHRYRMMSM